MRQLVSEPSPREEDDEPRDEDDRANGRDLDERGLPAIPAAKSVHRCTPAPVLDLVYQVLGRPVGIDPCSNERSIVEARRTIMPPENGLDAPWHEYQTGYVNPPFGRVEEPRWIQKAVQEAALGWEGIMLLPSKTGAPWFELLYRNSPCICFWGSPELDVEGRIWFHEEDGGATFNTEIVYFGRRYEAFARAFSRAGHLIYPRHDQALTLRIAGRTMTSVEYAGSAPRDELFRHAERRLRAARHDAWASSTDGLPPDTTVGDLPPSLRAQIDELTIHEARHALLLLARDEPTEPAATTRGKKKPKSTAPEVDRRQASLPIHTDGRAYHNDLERDRFVSRILDTLRSSHVPLQRADIVATNPCTDHEYRTAIKQLKKDGLISQVDEGKNAAYTATPPRNEHADSSTRNGTLGNADGPPGEPGAD